MKISRKKSGFTLIELSISALVVSLIIVTLIAVFRSNLGTFSRGQKRMEFTQSCQLVMKQIFTDLKRINPDLIGGKESNRLLMFKGEDIGDFVPNRVLLEDKDKNSENGCEELTLRFAELDKPEEYIQIRYYCKDKTLYRELKPYNGALKTTTAGKNVDSCHFLQDPLDICQIIVNLSATDIDSKKTEVIDFAVRLESNLIYVKAVYE